MKTILIIFILIVSLLISCTTTIQDDNKVREIISDQEDKEEAITRNENGVAIEYEKIDSDIIIENTQFKPNYIEIPFGNTTEIIIQNKDNLTYRLEIPMYGTEKQREIKPLESIVIKLSPKVKGITQIKLGDFTLGTIKVK